MFIHGKWAAKEVTPVATTGLKGTAMPLKSDATKTLTLARSVGAELVRSSQFRSLLIESIDLFRQMFMVKLDNRFKQGGGNFKETLKSDVFRGDTGFTQTKKSLKALMKNKGTQSQMHQPQQYYSNQYPTTTTTSTTTNTSVYERDVGSRMPMTSTGSIDQQIHGPLQVTNHIRVVPEGGSHVEVIDQIHNPNIMNTTTTSTNIPVPPPPPQWSTSTYRSTSPTHLQKTKNYYPHETEQQKRAVAIQFRQLLIKFGENPTFKETFKNLLKLIKHLNYRAMSMQKTSNVKDISTNPNLQLVWTDLKVLIQRFAGGREIDPLMNNIWKLIFMIREDENTKIFLRDLKHYVLMTMDNPTMLEDDNKIRELTLLMDRGRIIMKSPAYTKYVNKIMIESRSILSGISNDKDGKALFSTFTKFASDFMTDFKGKPSLWALQDSLHQFKYLMVPVVLKQLEYIALPKIYGSTPKYEYSVENMVFNGSDILPEHIHLWFASDMDLNIRQLSNQYARGELKLSVNNIRTMFQNIKFGYKKLTAPRLTDEGLLDIGLLGNGASISIDWLVETGNGLPMRFWCRKASCAIDEFSLGIKNSNHPFLGKVATKLFANTIKKRLEMAIADALLDFGTKISASLNEVIKNRWAASTGQNKSASLLGYGPTKTTVSPMNSSSSYAPSPVAYGSHGYGNQGYVQPTQVPYTGQQVYSPNVSSSGYTGGSSSGSYGQYPVVAPQQYGTRPY